MYKPWLVFVIFFNVLFISKLYAQTTDTINVYFGIDEFLIGGTQKEVLDKLLSKSNVAHIRIYGYTDFLGSDEYNIRLSERRSRSIENYLLVGGVDKKDIDISIGRGIHNNSSEENRTDMRDRGIQVHRKVEIIYTINNDIELLTENINEFEIIFSVNGLKNLREDDVVVGKTIILDDILFYSGTPKFIKSSEESLEQLYLFMKTYSSLKIEIQGHVCCLKDGVDSYDLINNDMRLSHNRAKAVFEYLVYKGISEERMTYKGYASQFKRYPLELDEYEEAMNRRVEILILEK